jgi:hypothetical protein
MPTPTWRLLAGAARAPPRPTEGRNAPRPRWSSLSARLSSPKSDHRSAVAETRIRVLEKRDHVAESLRDSNPRLSRDAHVLLHRHEPTFAAARSRFSANSAASSSKSCMSPPRSTSEYSSGRKRRRQALCAQCRFDIGHSALTVIEREDH